MDRRPSALDDAVLRAAQAGAGWAFTRIWRDLAPGIAGYARAHGCADADDVTSEVFLAAFTRIEHFEGSVDAFRSWVFAIAHHKVVDDVRRRARRGVPEQYRPDRDERVVASAEEDALAADGERRVRDALDGLAPDQRDVLLLRIIGDLTIEQIAVVLDKRIGAVKALQRRGLAALRRAWGSAVEADPVPPVPLEPSRTITGMR